MARSSEYFFRVPYRVLRALNRGDITFTQFGLLCFLVGAVDFRTGEAILSLRAIQDGCRWERSGDWLRKNLLALRESEWIDYDSKAGQQRPYVIRLRDAAVDGETPVSSTSAQISERAAAPGAEMTSGEGEGAAGPAPYRERPPNFERPQSGQSPREETRLDDDDDELQRVLESLGPFTRSQRRVLSEAFASAPEGFRQCVSAARKGKRPAGLLLKLIADDEHLRLDRSAQGGWMVDVVFKHPTDPALDEPRALGPYGSRSEADAEAAQHEGATVRHEGLP